jgi:hypothetical protein
MKTFFLIIVVLFSCVGEVNCQQNQFASQVKDRKLPFVPEFAITYEYNVNRSPVSSSGIGSKATFLYLTKRRFNAGLVVEWRMIPGLLFNRNFDPDLKNLLYPALSTYIGPDSLAMSQLGKVLNKESKLAFNGYIKAGIGLAFNYKVNTNSSIRVNSSLLFKKFRTEGNDTISNSYNDPSSYWLSTGRGYSARIEHHLTLRNNKILTAAESVKLILGVGFEIFNYNNLTYNNISLLENLNLTLDKKQSQINTYNIYFGISLTIPRSAKYEEGE